MKEDEATIQPLCIAISRAFAACLLLAGGALAPSLATADSCLRITLTGTQGGPPIFNGLAGSGTLVQYGDSENNCAATQLQFDIGRGTAQQLSKLGVPVGKIDAVFLSHLHSDHSEGLPDMMQLRWHFNSLGPKVDLVCTNDSKGPADTVLSCANFAQHIGDALINSGEVAQRLIENPNRLAGGPAELINVMDFEKTDEPKVVWESGDVSVSAISSTHIAGHASFRVDTPAGSVVIGGDAGNDTVKPPRETSTSAQVETLAMGADIIVHSAIHPVMGPDQDSGFPAPIYFRQSTATDLGAMAQRAEAQHLMMTHLIPPLGAKRQGPFLVPGGALSQSSYVDAAVAGGFEGEVIVGTDLVSLQLPASQ